MKIITNLLANFIIPTEQIISIGFIEGLTNALGNINCNIRREAASTAGRFVLMGANQIDLLMKNGVIKILVELLKMNDHITKNECMFAICNIINRIEDLETIRWLLNERILEIISKMLAGNNIKLLGTIMEALNKLLKYGQCHFCDKVRFIFN